MIKAVIFLVIPLMEVMILLTKFLWKLKPICMANGEILKSYKKNILSLTNTRISCPIDSHYIKEIVRDPMQLKLDWLLTGRL